MTAPKRTPLARLRPAPWNPRTIKDHRFENLCRSIQADPDFLRLRPVLAQSDGTIYAGNMRWRAAKHLGMSEVWAVVEDVPGQLAKERALRDNAGWGENVDDQVGALLAELKDAGSDIDLLGFDSPELDRLLGSVTQLPEEDEADLEPPAEPITRPGDLWLLGEHRLLCGDSADTTATLRLMNGQRVTLVLTDPPYGIGASSMTMGAGQSSKPKATRLSAGQTWDGSRLDVGYLLAESPWVCIWGGNYFTDVLPPTNHWLCWWKNNDGRSFSEFELAWTNYGRQSRHITHHWGREVKEYITQKPLAVMAYSIAQCPDSTGLIFDPFGGSGSTLIAAEQTGRTAYLMEIDPGYCDVIVSRWEKLTGKTAVLEGDRCDAAAA